MLVWQARYGPPQPDIYLEDVFRDPGPSEEKLKNKFLEIMRSENITQVDALKKAGISKSKLGVWRKNDAAFVAKLKKTKDERNSTLTNLHRRIIDLVAQGETKARAAAAAGIKRRTLAKWQRNNPALAHALAKASRDAKVIPHPLTVQQKEAVRLVATGLNQTKASNQLNISSSLISRWRKNPTFDDAIRKAKEKAKKRKNL